MAKGDALPKTLLSLEQFAAVEAWFEAMAKLAGLTAKTGQPHAPLITDVYQKRARAMLLLTGAKPPASKTVAPAAEDDFDDIA